MATYDNKVLTGDKLVYFSGLVKTALGGKQDNITFNTAYNATSNKAATMSDIPDISGKQDSLVFNTAYNASSNKVATMADIPDVSGKQDSLVFNTAYDASTNKVATMSDLPDVSGKQDALVFNSTYNASTNKVATMSDITNAIAGIGTFGFEIVNSLPVSDISTSTIYLVAKGTAGTNQAYTEYAYINNAWEIIGDTQISIATLSNNEIDTIWAAASAS